MPMKLPIHHLRRAFAFAILVAVSVSTFAEPPTQMPDAAKKLEQAYKQSVEAAIKPIRSRYLADLRKLQEQSMKSGKLNDAVALKQAIDTLAVGHLLGEWNSTGGRIDIRADHTAIWNNGGNTATWEIRGNDIILQWKNPKVVYTYSISDTGDTINGKHIDADGKSKSITATRIH